MELMYLAHVNFRPLDGGRLVSLSAPATPQAMRACARTSRPTLPRLAGYRDFLYPGWRPTPPGTSFWNWGWSSTRRWSVPGLPAGRGRVGARLMVHPDGYASYIGYAAASLDHAIRWISRTPDQDGLGLILPATAEPDGYRAEKAKGNVKVLAAGESVRFQMEAGLLTPERAA